MQENKILKRIDRIVFQAIVIFIKIFHINYKCSKTLPVCEDRKRLFKTSSNL